MKFFPAGALLDRDLTKSIRSMAIYIDPPPAASADYSAPDHSEADKPEWDPGSFQNRITTRTRSRVDFDLLTANRVIQQRACNGLSVDEVVSQVGTSRSVLQRKFRKAYNQTILDAILAVRVERAKILLQTTDTSIADIAGMAGFKSRAYLGYVLKKHTGLTPMRLRLDALSPDSADEDHRPENPI
jgi:AraC-like DNA-binding protein